MAIDWTKDVIAALQELEGLGGPSTEQYIAALTSLRHEIDTRLHAVRANLPQTDNGHAIHTFAPEDFRHERTCEECGVDVSRWCEVIDPTRTGDDHGGRVDVCLTCASDPAFDWTNTNPEAT